MVYWFIKFFRFNVIIKWFIRNKLSIIIRFILILIGFLFKLGVAPFHIWVPEVYEGAPSLVVLILLTLPKITILTFLIKFLYFIFFSFSNITVLIIFFTIFCSLLFGTIGAIYQTKLKRFIAYSAIANMGLY